MFGSIPPRVATLVLLGYAVVCAILIGVIFCFANIAGWSLRTTSAFDTARLFFHLIIVFLFCGIGVYRFAQFIAAVWISDRRIALIQSAWVYSPVVIALVFWWCGLLLEEVDFQNALPGLGSTFLESALRWIALIASITWVLVSAPIARLWATNSAENPEAILRAEEYLFVTKTQREIEAQVSIPTYYSLLVSISAMAFLILEATIGEMFERVTGISGYVGAMVAALGVTALLYPIRRRISAFVTRMQEEAQTSGRADALSAVTSAIASTGKYFAAELSSANDEEVSPLKAWLTIILLMVVLVAFFVFVVAREFPDP